jgi:dihydrofolate synthase/folylpolyglutamate synthase
MQATYSTTIEWLFQQFPSYQQIGSEAYKPDLENIQQLLHLLGEPQNELTFIHVAGTNGKGSTCAMLASILLESGQRVGLFTSPHIVDFRERIRVNGQMVGEEFVIDFCRKIQEFDLQIKPSFFEITFAMALAYFKKEECTICVIETGLGGRLDATNIILPILSIITNISLEHTQLLGETLSAIAGEKAGIIKKHVPCIIGNSTSETKPVFLRKAHHLLAPISFCEENCVEGESKFEPPLLGTYQHENLRTVLYSIHLLNNLGFIISDEHIQTGLNKLLQNTGFFGRMQIMQKHPLLILDVSHNEAGISQTLASMKKMTKGKLHLIYGSSSDKDYKKIIASFPPYATLALCAFKNQRSLSKKELEELAGHLTPKPQVFDHVKSAISTMQQKADPNDTILVFGSFFLISDYFF